MTRQLKLTALAAVFLFSLPVFTLPAGAGETLPEPMIERLHTMAADWNRGDMTAFLNGYWNDEGFVFAAGKSASRGWQSTRERYATHYPGRDKMGQVTFSEISARRFSGTSGMIFCRWTLDFGDHSATGYATFILERKGDTWRVTHEHASS
ncbi:YybH family protein [Kordiimonas lipolytica]|uniref:YybH family protein n=1 Tax=Kordiimonas lipolytica TaxID=1662421 RepID=A0ABV8UD87_9PROT|nr:nuclear transport factor 2 family protein [Kordiimonas lipolytica]